MRDSKPKSLLNLRAFDAKNQPRSRFHFLAKAGETHKLHFPKLC